MLQYFDSVRDWIPLSHSSPIFEASRHMLRDLLHSDVFLVYRSQEVAISIIYFLFICYGIKVPYDNVAQRSWYKVSSSLLFNFISRK